MTHIRMCLQLPRMYEVYGEFSGFAERLVVLQIGLRCRTLVRFLLQGGLQYFLFLRRF